MPKKYCRYELESTFVSRKAPLNLGWGSEKEAFCWLSRQNITQKGGEIVYLEIWWSQTGCTFFGISSSPGAGKKSLGRSFAMCEKLSGFFLLCAIVFHTYVARTDLCVQCSSRNPLDASGF